MDTVFVDSNVFLRYITRDDQGQTDRAKKLFKQAHSGEISLVTGPPVLFEIAWTLKIRYKQPPHRVLDFLESLVTTPWISMPDKDLALEAVRLAKNTEQDFADAYIHASACKSGAIGIATFNRKHFEKMGPCCLIYDV
jgi:predicted nucleic acid-binding protein